jgi:hypothetical protein
MYRYFTYGCHDDLVKLVLHEDRPWRTNWLAERQGRPVRSPYTGITKELFLVPEKIGKWLRKIFPEPPGNIWQGTNGPRG